MATENGVIRIGRKGLKKFAFGEDGEPFEVDVVVAFQEWIAIDEEFRDRTEDGSVATSDMVDYHRAAVEFAVRKSGGGTAVTTAEALDFLARLRELYDELCSFFLPRSRGGRESPDISGSAIQFSEES